MFHTAVREWLKRRRSSAVKQLLWAQDGLCCQFSGFAKPWSSFVFVFLLSFWFLVFFIDSNPDFLKLLAVVLSKGD